MPRFDSGLAILNVPAPIDQEVRTAHEAFLDSRGLAKWNILVLGGSSPQVSVTSLAPDLCQASRRIALSPEAEAEFSGFLKAQWDAWHARGGHSEVNENRPSRRSSNRGRAGSKLGKTERGRSDPIGSSFVQKCYAAIQGRFSRGNT